VNKPTLRHTRIGVLHAIAAYGFWGFVPVYYKAVAHVPVFELLGHRVVWSMVLTSALMLAVRGWRVALQALQTARALWLLCITTVLVATNWTIFMWAIANDRVLDASLGYYINPLVSILLGFVFLRERLNRLQILSVGLATVGVAVLTVSQGGPPWVALALAFSFGLYGLLRKIARLGAIAGLNCETLLLVVPAVAYLSYLAAQGAGQFAVVSRTMDLLLAFAGVATAVPLLLFTSAARRLRLSTIGFLQFLAPSIHFLLAVLLYGEPFTRGHTVCFGCIWTALTIFTFDSLRPARKSASQ
jgi:chloramphenicol-sensitive protein RarD